MDLMYCWHLIQKHFWLGKQILMSRMIFVTVGSNLQKLKEK